MKKTLLLAMTVFAAFTLKAGNLSYGGGSDKKLTIGVSIGAAIPMGDYGKKDTAGTLYGDNPADSNKLAGYASTGFHFDITAGYLFGSSFGGMVLIGGNMNSYDVATFESSTGTKLSSGETYSRKSYYLGQYLVGPFLSLPAGDKLRIDIRLLVGLVTLNNPTSTYTSGSGVTITNSGTGANAFGYHFGAGIKYNFNDKMGLTFNLAYTGSSVTYSSFTQTETFGNSTTTNTNNGHRETMSVGLLTATVGIAFNL